MEWSSIYKRVSASGPGFARAWGRLSFRNLGVVLLLTAATAELSAQSVPPPLFEAFPRRWNWLRAPHRGVAIGDVNGNGYPDMATPGAESIRLHLNRGDSTFAETPLPVNRQGADYITVINARFGDINGNGRLDLVAIVNFLYVQTVRQEPAIVIFLGDGRGGFVEMPRGYLIPNDLQRIGFLELADVTGNGACDIFIGRPWNDWQDVLYLNDGRGFFRNVSSTHLPGYAPNNYPIVAQSIFADLTGNGFLDLVLACGPEFPEINRVYLNDGTGRFLNVVFLGTIPDLTESVAAGDVDGDGRPDIVCGNSSWHTRQRQDTLFLNQGHGVFLDATDRLPQDQDRTVAIALGDITGNGHLDILAGGSFPGVRIYLNDGRGRFPTSSRDLVDWPSWAYDMRLVDIDGDGDLDLFVSNTYGVFWLMNLTRHLYTQETVQLGGSLNLTFYGAPMQFFLPALSLAPARISLPGLGIFGLDPTAMLVLPAEMIPPGEHTVTTTLSLPADPALRGVNLYSQALVVDLANPANTRLTNWLSDQLR